MKSAAKEPSGQFVQTLFESHVSHPYTFTSDTFYEAAESNQLVHVMTFLRAYRTMIIAAGDSADLHVITNRMTRSMLLSAAAGHVDMVKLLHIEFMAIGVYICFINIYC